MCGVLFAPGVLVWTRKKKTGNTLIILPVPTMEPLYEYDPLDSNILSARVIKLKPAADFGAALQCDILVIDLSTNVRPKYEAISYTWEGQVPSPDYSIWCHSQGGGCGILWITKNSDAALRRMRFEHEARYLWMDLICINQKSEDGEKNQQVANMGYVYTGAERVLIWLGEIITARTGLALTFLKRIATHDPGDPNVESKLTGIFDEIRQGDH